MASMALLSSDLEWSATHHWWTARASASRVGGSRAGVRSDQRSRHRARHGGAGCHSLDAEQPVADLFRTWSSSWSMPGRCRPGVATPATFVRAGPSHVGFTELSTREQQELCDMAGAAPRLTSLPTEPAAVPDGPHIWAIITKTGSFITFDDVCV